MLILGMIIIGAAIVEIVVLILEKQGNPGDLEQYYRLQEKNLHWSSKKDSQELEGPARHTGQTRHIDWQSMVASVAGYLGKRSRAFIMFLGLVLVLLLGFIDYLTGPDLMFLIFYLAPIFLVSWFAGRRAGVLTAIASAMVWAAADIMTVQSFPHPVFHYWNTAMKLSLFLTVNYMFSILKAALEKLRRVNTELEMRVEERTAELTSTNEILREQIAERKRAEEKVREQAAQFLRIQRMESIGTLASGIAHDLNNIFSPILLSAHVLHEKLTDQESLNLLEVISRGARRGTNMVKQVLSFARGIDGERIELKLDQLLDEISKFLKQTLPKSIQIETLISRELWPVIGDPTQLYQVLMNLCLNARDAMPGGGKLTIKGSNLYLNETQNYMNTEARPGPFIMITVEDTGEGIPADIIGKIFEPFFTTKEFGKGTGLGLSTALGIMKGHEGFINVYSEAGKGTSFRIYLPAATESIKMQQPEENQLPMGLAK